MSSKIFADSRYANVDQFLEEGGTAIFVVPRRPISKTDYPDNIVHTVRAKDRVDLISSKYYGTPQYGWVIADFNDLLFADGEGQYSLQGRDVIILPSLHTLLEKIIG